METAQTFASQAEQYLSEIARKRKPNTLHVYRSILDNHLLPILGEEALAAVTNKTAKLLATRLTEGGLSPATVNLAVTLMKQVLASAVDEDGNQLYPRTWNHEFIEAPEVDPASQKAPIMPREGLQEAISEAFGPTKALVGLLAGTGLRIGEALAIGLGNDWDPINGTITVSGTLVMGTYQPSPKTKAGKRIVDLPKAINDLLKTVQKDGPLFPASVDTYRRQIDALHIPGFHSLRRFRITHLQANSVPLPLIKFWAGHAASDITERYTKVGAMLEERKTWAEKAGLGFQL